MQRREKDANKMWKDAKRKWKRPWKMSRRWKWWHAKRQSAYRRLEEQWERIDTKKDTENEAKGLGQSMAGLLFGLGLKCVLKLGKRPEGTVG